MEKTIPIVTSLSVCSLWMLVVIQLTSAQTSVTVTMETIAIPTTTEPDTTATEPATAATQHIPSTTEFEAPNCSSLLLNATDIYQNHGLECEPLRVNIKVCNEYEGRDTGSAFFQIVSAEKLLKNATITTVRALAESLTENMFPVCVDYLLHILCLLAAPPCNQDTCLPMLICKESCDIFKRMKASNFCKAAEDHLRRILRSDQQIFSDVILLINAYFKFDCEDPSTYFFTNISNPDPKACTKLLSPGSLSSLPCEVLGTTNCTTTSTPTVIGNDQTLLLAILLPLLLILFAVFLFTVICLSRYSSRRKRKQHSSESTEFVDVNSERARSELAASLSSMNDLHIYETASENEMYKLFKDCLIPYQSLALGDSLGQGAFGKVFKGELRTENGVQEVAVKTLKNLASFDEVNEFLSESAIMKDFHHPHVLGLVGVVFDTPDGVPYLVLPFMEFGNLKNFLKTKRMEDSNTSELPQGLELSGIVKMSIDIAQGMKYLAEMKFVHRDLAARNCMVGKDLLIKVGDFGLARDIYHTDYYRSSNKDAKLPIKWMPPEAFNDKISNEKTDVWSYGVTCWEVFSLGRTPYPTVPNNEIFKYISSGRRLEKPVLCPEEVFEFMENCWEFEPECRPNFSQLVEELTEYWDDKYGYY